MVEAMVKPSSLQAFAHRPALVRSKCGFENRIKNTFFIRSVSAYRELLIAAVLVVTIVQHRTSVLDKTACVCSKTSRVEHTKSVGNRPKPAVFVRTALGLSSKQNEVAINSKSGLWRTALLNLLLVMILRAFFCNVNIRLHLKPQAVMQKYICGKIKELYIRLRICCGIDFFILCMMPIVFVILFDMLVMCEFQSI